LRAGTFRFFPGAVVEGRLLLHGEFALLLEDFVVCSLAAAAAEVG